MATDYDTPRTNDSVSSDSIEEFKNRRNAAPAVSGVDLDEFEVAEGLELPGADLSGEELVVRVLPQLEDEFICATCFLVCHRSQLAGGSGTTSICRDCDYT